MMAIQEKNEVINQMISQNILTGAINIKTMDEFGYFKYFLDADFNEQGQPTFVKMAFASKDAKKIYEYSGKAFIEKEFKDYTCEQNVKANNATWDIVLKANVEKFQTLYMKKKKKKKEEDDKEEQTEETADKKALRKELQDFANTTSQKFSLFRVKFYASVLDQMLVDLMNKKTPNTFTYNLNKDNVLHIMPHGDRIVLIYGINFSQETDVSLAKIFLMELEEAKRHVKNCVSARVFFGPENLPNDIAKIDTPKKYSNGLCVFDLYTKNYKLLSPKLSYFVNLRQYIQFHIHSIKTFLHIRMNRKGKEIETNIKACKIIPEEYLKSLESTKFFLGWAKKISQQETFSEEAKKVQVN